MVGLAGIKRQLLVPLQQSVCLGVQLPLLSGCAGREGGRSCNNVTPSQLDLREGQVWASGHLPSPGTAGFKPERAQFHQHQLEV
jgi:hypothetical protein